VILIALSMYFSSFSCKFLFPITWYSSYIALSKRDIITFSGFNLEASYLTRLLAGCVVRKLCYKPRKIPRWTSHFIIDTLKSNRLPRSGCIAVQGRRKLHTQFYVEASCVKIKCKSKDREIKVKIYLQGTTCENALAFGKYPRIVIGSELYYWSTEHVLLSPGNYHCHRVTTQLQ